MKIGRAEISDCRERDSGHGASAEEHDAEAVRADPKTADSCWNAEAQTRRDSRGDTTLVSISAGTVWGILADALSDIESFADTVGNDVIAVEGPRRRLSAPRSCALNQRSAGALEVRIVALREQRANLRSAVDNERGSMILTSNFALPSGRKTMMSSAQFRNSADALTASIHWHFQIPRAMRT